MADKPKHILDSAFKYDKACVTASPGYLKAKWDRLYPGWSKKSSTSTGKMEIVAQKPLKELPTVVRILKPRRG